SSYEDCSVDGARGPTDLNAARWLRRQAKRAAITPNSAASRWSAVLVSRVGKSRTVNIREVLNPIFYVLSTGCQWQALPKDLPPKSTAHSYFMLWDWDGTLERAHHALYVATREREGREASPTAAIIDSQSAKA